MVPHEFRQSPRVPGITVDPGDPPGHSETALCGSAHSFQLFPPFLPGSSPALQAGASCLGPLAAICFLALPSAHGTGPGLLPGSLPVTRRLPHAVLLCHQFGSEVYLPAAHSRALLCRVLSNPLALVAWLRAWRWLLALHPLAFLRDEGSQGEGDLFPVQPHPLHQRR